MGWWKEQRKKLEVVLTRLAIAVVGRLPRTVVLGLARFLGAAGWLFSRSLRRIGRANLDLAYGDTRPAREKQRMLKRSFQAFALVALDVFWFTRRTAARIRRWVSFERPLAEVLGSGAQVCLTGHLGNWEILGLACAVEGYPLASVAMPLKNPEVDALFNKLRQSTGQAIIPREGAVRALLRLLHDGRNVALLLDQNTPPSEGGLFIEFFGRPVTVSSAAVFLAARTGSGIVFGFCLPDGRGGYRVRIPPSLGVPPSRPDEAQIRDWTEKITRLYEEEVRRCPECWLWTYKRWKYVRPGDDADSYPYYASRDK
jgi:KDO2-lipid IV(A) lauroyltransferase